MSSHLHDEPAPAQALHAQGELFMNLALEASLQALPACLPNPPVGCVIVRDGQVLAEGHTHPPGQFHAEAHALIGVHQRLAGADLLGVTPGAFHDLALLPDGLEQQGL